MLIAEVAQAHDGSLGMAHAYIDAVADAGADAVKFQTHIAAAESSPAEPWRVHFSKQDATRYEYWQRMEFTEEQWAGLAEHARSRNLIFLSSPFSAEAVALLERIGMPAWKVASGEVSNPLLLDRLIATGSPILLSSGMSRYSELDVAVEAIRRGGNDMAIFQCTTAYPTAPEEVGLNVLGELARRYQCPVGLSDHSATIYAPLAAVTLGAALIEVHVTLSRRMFGPDVPASLTVEELASLAAGTGFISTAMAHPIDKEARAAELEGLRQTFGKSLWPRMPLSEGTVLRREHLCARKPGNGIPAAELHQVLGRQLRRSAAPDQPLAWSDFSEARAVCCNASQAASGDESP